MNRYIDVDKIDIRAREGYNHDGVLYLPYRDIKKSLDSAPSIDIVFCEECCKHKTEDCAMAWWDNHWGEYLYPHDDDFCSYGKRKDK